MGGDGGAMVPRVKAERNGVKMAGGQVVSAHNNLIILTEQMRHSDMAGRLVLYSRPVWLPQPRPTFPAFAQ